MAGWMGTLFTQKVAERSFGGRIFCSERVQFEMLQFLKEGEGQG